MPKSEFILTFLRVYAIMEVWIEITNHILYTYDQTTQQQIIAAMTVFLDASYNSIDEINAAYETLKTAIDAILAGK